MSFSLEIKSSADTGVHVGALRHAVRALAARLLSLFGSGATQAEIHEKAMELYQADDSMLKDMGLTRMDVIRLLETKAWANSVGATAFENRSSRPQPNAADAQWERLPLANLGHGLLPF